MSECIFCKIVANEIPATTVYEDEEVLVFMDIGPIIKGHALVIPKRHYDPVTDIPDDLLGKLHRVAKKIAGAQMNGLGADGVNIIQNNGKAAGQEVPAALSVVGYDDFEIATRIWPRLTTIHTPTREIGEMAAKHLLQTEADPPGRSETIPQLVERDSTRMKR